MQKTSGLKLDLSARSSYILSIEVKKNSTGKGKMSMVYARYGHA